MIELKVYSRKPAEADEQEYGKFVKAVWYLFGWDGDCRPGRN